MTNQYIDGLVSIIIPVYNSSRYIEKTILSVENQTYKNIEVVIVDDCSKDASAEIIFGLKKHFDNIIYYKLDKNSGAAVARNKAIEMAKGQFIAFLDSDDIWYPDKLMKQIECLRNNKAAFCYTAIEMIDERGNLIKPKREVMTKVTYKKLLKNTIIATSTVLLDRKIVCDIQMPLIRSGQDYATWLQILRSGIVAYGIDEALVKYRKSENSLSAKKTRNFKKVWNIQVKHEKINPVLASINTCHYIWNAVKKYYM